MSRRAGPEDAGTGAAIVIRAYSCMPSALAAEEPLVLLLALGTASLPVGKV